MLGRIKNFKKYRNLKGEYAPFFFTLTPMSQKSPLLAENLSILIKYIQGKIRK